MAGRWLHRGLMAASLLPAFIAVPALAQDGAIDVTDAGDTAWVLAAAILSLLASLPGLALVICAHARGRNHATALYQSITVALLIALLWIATGYTLAFGVVSGGWLGGGNAWMLLDLGNVRSGSAIAESAFVLLQLPPAILASMLITGALIGRINTAWLLIFTGLWSLVVYAPAAHWILGGGWLATSVGTLDWNGGIVTQITAAVTALVLARQLGPRQQDNATPVPLGPVIAMLGAVLFLLGQAAANGGGALAANDDAAAAMLSTLAAAAGGTMAWLVLCRIARQQAGPLALTRGLLAGLATVAPAAGFVSPGAALLLGALGGVCGRFVAQLIRTRTSIDDSTDIFALFGVTGIAGALLLGIFIAPVMGGTGFGHAQTLVGQLVAQAVGVAVCALWALVSTVILATMVSIVVPMRVSQDRELKGLDVS